MSLLTALRETVAGFKSLLTGMRITAREAAKPSITVQYPHDTLKMADRFRGHVKLVLDPVTGKSRCTSCNLSVRACPSDCLTVEGIKREGEKKKSVSEYTLDFTTCSLCGSCVEACPSDAIEYSKDYNVVSLDRAEFARMDLLKKLEAEAKVWAEKNPELAAAAAAAAAAQAAAATAKAPAAATTASAPGAGAAPVATTPAPTPAVAPVPAAGVTETRTT